MKIKSLLPALVSVLLLVQACTVADCEPACDAQFELREFVLTASAEPSPGTRTIIQGDKSIWWEAADEIKLFFGSEGARFVSTNTEPAAKAEFRGSLNVLTGFDENEHGEGQFWGLYPYREDAVSDGSSVTTTLPVTQQGREGSFEKNSYISLGCSPGLSMAFWGVCGGLRFTLTQDGIRKVTLKARGGESLAGRIRIVFSDGVPAITSTSGSSDTVTLLPPSGETFKTGVWYYIIALPGTLSQGYSLTFVKGSRVAERVSGSSVTIKRKTFGSIAEADKGLEFNIPGIGDPTAPIEFADAAVKAKLVASFDTNGDGEISYAEADAVTSIAGVFGSDKDFTSFDEFRFFTGVTEVPQMMFRGWTSLTSIMLPESVKTLGRYAFQNCSKLESIALPDGLTTMGDYCFQSCAALKDIEFPSALSAIPSWAFYSCTSFTSLTIPENIKTIGDNAFRACNGITEVSLPKGLESLGANAFRACKGLTDFEFPACLSSVPDGLLYGCSALSSVTIPSHITAIGSSSFENCTGLTVFTIPAWVKSIGAGALRGCTALTGIFEKSSVPPTGGSQMFHDTGNCPIYIPTGGGYSETEYWKDYVKRFVTEDGSSIYYESKDYSRDGEVVLLQKATVGRGVNFILLGDGFLDRDMGDGGLYEQRMRQAMEYIFLYEPYKTLRNRFNIYTVKIVSANNRYNDATSNRRLTYDSDGSINFRSEVCTQYGNKVPNPNNQPLKMAALCNSSSRVGRSFCTRTWSGWACCIVYDPNGHVLVHELAGHGFGDLWDEYTEKNETFTDTSNLDYQWALLAWGANTDWRSDPAEVRWAKFLSDSRYSNEELGVFEGAKLYTKGIYRPTLNSMMRSNNCPFNAPSREQIYRNTMRWSEGSDWTYDYETFASTVDVAGRAQAAGRLGSHPSVPSAAPAREGSILPANVLDEPVVEDAHIPPVIIDEDVVEVSVNLTGKPVIKLTRR